MAQDDQIAERLNAISGFTPDELEALQTWVTPPEGFEARTKAAVRDRIDSPSSASTIIDLLGLGFHVGRTLLVGGDEHAADQAEHHSAEEPDKEF